MKHRLKSIGKMNQYKKYYKILITLVLGFGAINIINKSPKASYQNMKSLHEFIQVMPIDKQSKDLLTPFFQRDEIYSNNPSRSISTINQSGKKTQREV